MTLPEKAYYHGRLRRVRSREEGISSRYVWELTSLRSRGAREERARDQECQKDRRIESSGQDVPDYTPHFRMLCNTTIMNNQEQISARQFLSDNSATLERLAAQYGFSQDAARTLLQSLLAGGGTMAQFSHPELGGTGQWTKGGMIMIGDMFNHALKARVDGLCSELADLLQKQPTQSHSQSFAAVQNALDPWWGTDLGVSSTSGSQNNMRYAYFPVTRRLAILDDKRVTIYDTGSHNITGVSQQQSNTGSLTFTSQQGSVRLTDLSVVSGHGTDKSSPEAPPQAASSPNPESEPSADIFYKIERLAELRDKGILSADEFLLKKTELLTKL